MSGFASPEATPRKRKLSPYTPKSVCKKSFSSGQSSSIVTPEHKISRYTKSNVDSLAASSPADLSIPAVLLPTPSTVGSDRSKNHEGVVPSKRSRNLTACLQALAGETTEPAPNAQFSPGLKIHFTAPTEGSSSSAFSKCRRLLEQPAPICTNTFSTGTPPSSMDLPSSPDASTPKCPRTPPQLTIKQESFFEDAYSDDERVEIVNLSDLDKIPRHELSNPFLEKNPSKHSEKSDMPIDLSETIELINHTTGERKLSRMTDDQKRFKPRKLVFTEPPPSKLNYNVTNKFIGKTIGRNFTLHDAPGLAPGFEIYDDSE